MIHEFQSETFKFVPKNMGLEREFIYQCFPPYRNCKNCPTVMVFTPVVRKYIQDQNHVYEYTCTIKIAQVALIKQNE
jgi:hypothetical protein